MLLKEILETIELDRFYNLGEATNAKLYDVSYYCYENNIDDGAFNSFCEIEYYFFSDYLKEVGAETTHIGRTSSFYFVPRAFDFNCYYMSSFNNSDIVERRRMLFDEFLYHTGIYDSLGEMIDAGWGVDDIKKEWAQYCDDVLDPINEAWDYLDCFKANQVNNFIDYLNNNLDIEIVEAA